ncbi:hypothetical protein HYC85_000333 [Camellia sinensis]|uniref:Haem-binding uptake Tiki superfamily ChaN domain-containing protein n=1 Tax=Camellia sinensis TaxID=4442 RepID=A0A7J7I3Z0_CAMSI|nr:hypothetical protein HYC85_000333 [Camellia sinensis]
MKPHHTHRGFTSRPAPALHLYPTHRRLCVSPEIDLRPRMSPENHRSRHVSAKKRRRITLNIRHIAENSGEFSRSSTTGRRDVLVTPFLAIGACFLRSAVARADEKTPESGAATPPPETVTATTAPPVAKVEGEAISSRVYDATVIGEPMAVGKDKRKVWDKLMNARVVYLGEAEQVPIGDDKVLELEIAKNLRKRCLEAERPLSLALEAFPCNLQEQLNQYMDKRVEVGGGGSEAMADSLLDLTRTLSLTSEEDTVVRLGGDSTSLMMGKSDMCLVGKLLTRRLFNVDDMKSTLLSVWQPTKGMQIVELHGAEQCEFEWPLMLGHSDRECDAKLSSADGTRVDVLQYGAWLRMDTFKSKGPRRTGPIDRGVGMRPPGGQETPMRMISEHVNQEEGAPQSVSPPCAPVVVVANRRRDRNAHGGETLIPVIDGVGKGNAVHVATISDSNISSPTSTTFEFMNGREVTAEGGPGHQSQHSSLGLGGAKPTAIESGLVAQFSPLAPNLLMEVEASPLSESVLPKKKWKRVARQHMDPNTAHSPVTGTKRVLEEVVVNDGNLSDETWDVKAGNCGVVGRSPSQMEHFRNVIADAHLANLGFVGPIFTWSNNRGGNALVRERLDRGFANDAWQLLFPHAKVYPMACTSSDHLPICVDICGAKEQCQSPASGHLMYRFEAMWLRHANCEQVVADNWLPSSNADVRSLVSIIAHVSSSLRRWDRNVFGCVKRQLKEKTDQLQRLLTLSVNFPDDVAEMCKLRCDIDELLERESIFWGQRARANWLKDGDRNTCFFIPRPPNVIRRRKLLELFSAGEGLNMGPVLQLIQERVSDHSASQLSRPFSEVEVHHVLFQMHPTKAPGPDETLKSFASHWPPQRWQEYEPLLTYCRDNGVGLVACGTPLEVLRTVQAEGIRGLSKADRKIYAPPAGSGFISGFTSISRRSSADINFPNQSASFGPSSYLSAQARVVEEYTVSEVILRAMSNGGATGMLVVVTGASHVTYGSSGTGLPARISRKIPKKNQVVILLDPERQYIRREGEVPVADFLWYSAARPCSRNCFDRAEIARVMNAAGRRRDGLPQDLQKGLDLGVVSPEVLQNFFDLEQYPFISELTHQFQGFRERLLADPKFLHRLAIEEAISITTTLLAQYERRKENFFEELDYVITDTVRGSVVDFFTVWLPAPTLSFLSIGDTIDTPDSVETLKGLLGSIPDNAFQKNIAGKDWNVNHRVASVLFGGLKLAGVGFISSIGTVVASNILYAVRKLLNPALDTRQRIKRSPILKTAVVYGGFLGTSANLRYQVIAGIVEHRISDQFASQTLLVNMLSFFVRTVNSYWGTQQWVDLARFTGLQATKSEPPSFQTPDSPNQAALECNAPEEAAIDEIKNQ